MTARKRLPRLPKVVQSPAGPVPVVRKKGLVDEEGVKLFGLWCPAQRVIYLDAELRLDAAHHTLRHEQAHAWLEDSGVYFEDEQLLERVCDAIATCRMSEVWWDIRKGGK